MARARGLKIGDLPPDVRAKIAPKRKERLSKEQKAAAEAIRDAQRQLARETFFKALDAGQIPRPVHEHAFYPTRDWRFDYAWIEPRVALEVEGGVWTHGRHTRGSGFVKDMEKYNAAATLGWRVLRVMPDKLTAAFTVETIRRALR